MLLRLLRTTLPVLALCVTSPASAQKPDANKDDKKEAEAKLIKAGEIAGEVIHVEPNKSMFRVKVSYSYYEPNQGNMNAVAQARLRLAQARNRDEYFNAQRELARAMAQPMYNARTASKDLNIDFGEDMKVRMAQPKADFDDMGNLKKLTAKEIAAMKGKDGLFDGETTDIQNGVKVRVTLLRTRPMAKPKGRDDVGIEEEKLYASKVIVLPMPVPPAPR